MNTDTFLQWLRLGAAVLCANLLLNAQLTAQQQAAEFTPPFEPGDILVYDVDSASSPFYHQTTFIISTGPGSYYFQDKESWFVSSGGYPFISATKPHSRHHFSVDTSGFVLHEGELKDTRYQVYPAFVPSTGQVIMNGEAWNVPRVMDTTVLGVTTRAFELERGGLRRIITERFGEIAMILDGKVVMTLSSAVVRDTAFERGQTKRVYLPLCVGNNYVHFRYRDWGLREEALTLVTEEAVFDGQTWFHLEGRGPLLGWFRSDSTGVYNYDNGQANLIIAGDASLGTRTAYGMIVDTGMVEPFPHSHESFFYANDWYSERDYKRYRKWYAEFGLFEQYVWGFATGTDRYVYVWGVICGETIGVIVDVDRPQPAAEMARINEIYPNPASQLTTVSFSLSSATQAEFILTDMLGRRARHIDAAEYPAGSHRSMLSLDGLRRGLYLLTLRTPSSTVTRCVIVTP